MHDGVLDGKVHVPVSDMFDAMLGVAAPDSGSVLASMQCTTQCST